MRIQWDSLCRGLVLSIVVVAGCTREQEHIKATHTVEQYRSDDQLRYAKQAECSMNPGELEKTPDCINAKAATGRNAEGQQASMTE